MKLYGVTRQRVLLQCFVALSWITIPVLVSASRISVDFMSFFGLYFYSFIFYVISVICIWRKDKVVSALLEIIAAKLMLLVPVLAANYLAISLNYPLQDNHLLALDQALGFDWLAFVLWVDKSAVLSWSLSVAYQSFTIQLLVVPILLVFFAESSRSCAFVAGFGIICFISSAISVFYPALAMYEVMGYAQEDMTNINVHFGYHFLESFSAVRSGEPFTVASEAVSGILTFPSVHAAIAFLVIWALWEIKWLRYPAVFLNVAMAISAITHGSHYLVDVIAGAGVTGVTVMILEWVFLGRRFSFLSAGKLKSGLASSEVH